MKISFRLAFACIAVVAGIAVCATNPGASSEHYVLANDNSLPENLATVMKLGGTSKNPVLTVGETLQTGVSQPFGGFATPTVQIIRAGADVCVFIGNTPGLGGNDISAFQYPGLQLVGNYSDPQVQSTSTIAIAAHGSYLFAGYMSTVGDFYLDTWQINSDCSLSLLHTVIPANPIGSLAVTPNGQVLLASYTYFGEVGSFSIASDGSLTPHGPYDEGDGEGGWGGVDITADGKYALFNITSYPSPPNDDPYTQVNILPINSDGTLGKPYIFGGDGTLGLGYGAGAIRLSPNQKFIFTSDIDSGSQQITSLNFTESPLDVTYGCIAKPRNLEQPTSIGGLATALPSGSGGGLYVTETSSRTASAAVALFGINPTTGCLKEAPQSPFSINNLESELNWVAVWPPRPF